MSQEQLVSAYVRGDISRRTFIRRLVAVGVSLGAAVSYAELLGQTSVAQAASKDFYDGCEGYYENAQMRPAVTTLPAEDVTETTARLRGSIEPKYRTARVRFAYGTTPDLGAQTPEETRSAPGTHDVSATLTGLQPGTTYHARIVSRNAAGCADGETITFTTVAPPPPPPPPPPADLRAPLTTLAALSTDLGAILRRRTIAVKLGSDEAASVVLRGTAVQVTKPKRGTGRTPARKRTKTVTVAKGSVVLPAAGTKNATLKLTLAGRRLLARLDRATVQIVATATDGSGNSATSSRTLRLTRRKRRQPR